MDTAEKRIARAEELHAATPEQWIVDVFGRVISRDGNVVAVCPEPHLRKSSEAWPVNRRFIAESRALLHAIATDAKRARHELTIEQALTAGCSRLVIDCLGATGVDVEALAYAPYDATALNAMRRGLPERIRDTVSQRDRAIERAEKAERERDQALQRLSWRDEECDRLKSAEDRTANRAAGCAAALDLLRQYQAACARWTASKDPRDEAEVARIRGQLAIVALPNGGE